MNRKPENILWRPSTAQMQSSAMYQFMQHINEKYRCEMQDYHALQRWSVDYREKFWQSCLEFTDIVVNNPASTIYKPGKHIREDRWFDDCQLNFAENLLRFDDEQTALVFADEKGNRQKLTYAELRREVQRVAGWLKAQGVVPGDRVAGFAANRIETVVAMLAASSLGAVWSSCSPDFGVGGVLDRFTQIEPKVLFAVSSHCYAGKIIPHTQTLESLLQSLPSVEHLVLMPDLYLGNDDISLVGTTEVHDWSSLEAPGTQALDFYPAAFNDPLFIMYSSGTTGVPKCIVHGTGGTLLQHRKEHHLHVGLQRSDVFFYFTTCGWMMWNWLVSGLASGATLVLYDGSPFHPVPTLVFDLIDEFGITVCGVSAKYISAAEKAGLQPAQTHKLDSLRTLLSTGSPLNAEGFDYVYQHVKKDLALNSISGGTDIISCFVLGSPLLPVQRGEIQCAGLGMDVAVFNEDAEPVTGIKGELVCRHSFPSMPVGFWNDSDNKKYQKAYFERFPGVWTHGDYAEQTEHHGYIIHGRSDTVLNPGGVRIGTAEIYRQVEKLPEVVESIVVGQHHDDDVRVVLFVRLASDHTLDVELETRIRKQIREGASPRHVPAAILPVNDIPRTLSGKIAEVAVRDTINGQAVNNRDALANPEALDEYDAMRERLK